MSFAAVTETAERLMRAVVASGCIRREIDSDATVACQVMREELKEFLTGPRYADERELIKSPNGAGLAFSSLVASCVARILKERAIMPAETLRPGRHLINEAGTP